MNCPIDGEKMRHMFDARVLNRYPASYFRCPRCLLLQPKEPCWLEEAYSEAIAITDVGLVARNRVNWVRVELLLDILFGAEGRFLDIGGGYGLLCRGLRDDGYDCYTTDPFCKNLFAKGFEPNEPFHADALLAFEVMEHLTNPMAFVSAAFEKYHCRTLVFSTLIHRGPDIPKPDWWYYAFETGQHVSFYHEQTLSAMARQLGVGVWSLSDELHVFSDRVPESALFKRILGSRRFGPWLHKLSRKLHKRVSYTQLDYEAAKSALRAPHTVS